MTKEQKYPTLLIIGQARHGKDTAAEYWNKHFGLSYQSSSMAAAEIFIFDELKDKYGYNTFEECFEDRVNHREEWFNMICDYNKDDLTRLGRAIVDKTGCYVGMRNIEEVEACKDKGVFDFIVWIDAGDRLPPEDKASCTVTSQSADIVIENNGTQEEFEKKLERIGKIIFT